MPCSRFLEWKDCKDSDSNIPYSFEWEPWTTKEQTTLVDNVANYEITFELNDEDDSLLDITTLVIGTVTVDVTNSIIYVWLTGGTPGIKYNINCHCEFANGIIEEQTAVLTVTDK